MNKPLVIFLAFMVALSVIFAFIDYANAQDIWYSIKSEPDFWTGKGGYTMFLGNDTNNSFIIIGDDKIIMPYGYSSLSTNCSVCTEFLKIDGSNSPTSNINWNGQDITNLDYMDANNISTERIWDINSYYGGNSVCLSPDTCKQYIRRDTANTLTEIGFRNGANEYSYSKYSDNIITMTAGDVFISNTFTVSSIATQSNAPIYAQNGVIAYSGSFDDIHTGSDGMTSASSTGNQAGFMAKDTSATPITYSFVTVGGLNQLWILPEAITVTGTTKGIVMYSNGRTAFGDGGISTGQLNIDGNSDIPQFVIQGHSTQTNDLAVFEQSGGTDVFTVSNGGNTYMAGNVTIGGSLALGGQTMPNSSCIGCINATDVYANNFIGNSPIVMCEDEWCVIFFPRWQKTYYIKKDFYWNVTEIRDSDGNIIQFSNIPADIREKAIAKITANKNAVLLGDKASACNKQFYHFDYSTDECIHDIELELAYDCSLQNYHHYNYTLGRCIHDKEAECLMVSWQIWKDNTCYSVPALECGETESTMNMTWDMNTQSCVYNPIAECMNEGIQYYWNSTTKSCDIDPIKECESDVTKYWYGDSCKEYALLEVGL